MNLFVLTFCYLDPEICTLKRNRELEIELGPDLTPDDLAFHSRYLGFEPASPVCRLPAVSAMSNFYWSLSNIHDTEGRPCDFVEMIWTRECLLYPIDIQS